MFNNKLVDTSKFEDKDIKHKNKAFPKHTYRWLFIGSSGSGKTNTLINCLDNLDFDKLHIICPTADTQPKYLYLKEKLDKEDVPLIRDIEKYNKKHKTDYTLDPRIELHTGIPDDFIGSLNKNQQNLVVFDDCVVCSKKEEKEIIDCYIRGRHQNCSFIYLTQSFYKVPRVIRLNANCFNIFHSVNKSELAMLHKDMGLMSDKKEFVKTISELIEPLYSFVHINTDSNKPFRHQDMVKEIKFNT